LGVNSLKPVTEAREAIKLRNSPCRLAQHCRLAQPNLTSNVLIGRLEDGDVSRTIASQREGGGGEIPVQFHGTRDGSSFFFLGFLLEFGVPNSFSVLKNWNMFKVVKTKESKTLFGSVWFACSNAWMFLSF
jgi:hypothetical protein